MNVTNAEIRTRCTDAVFERGVSYRDEGRIERLERFDRTVTAVVRGRRRYDLRVEFPEVDADDGFDTWCGCPYDGPGICKHCVAVLLSLSDDVPADESDRLDRMLENVDTETLQTFLRTELAADPALRERFLAYTGEPSHRSVDDIRVTIDRRFEQRRQAGVVAEPIDISDLFARASTYRSRDRYRSAATVYRALVESLDDNMHFIDGAYDHFDSAFRDALQGYVDCIAMVERNTQSTPAIRFLEERSTAGSGPFRDQFREAAAELRSRLDETDELC